MHHKLRCSRSWKTIALTLCAGRRCSPSSLAPIELARDSSSARQMPLYSDKGEVQLNCSFAGVKVPDHVAHVYQRAG